MFFFDHQNVLDVIAQNMREYYEQSRGILNQHSYVMRQ